MPPRKRDAFSSKNQAGKLNPTAKPRTFERLRIDHSAKLTPRLRRRVSAGRNLRFELEARAFPENIVNGTLLERIVAKQVHDRGFRFSFQEVLTTGLLTEVRLDVAVYGTGISEPLDIEANGLVWHTDTVSDELRRMQLRMMGVVVIDVWENDLVGPEEVMHRVIDDALRGISRPRPTDMPTPIRFN